MKKEFLMLFKKRYPYLIMMTILLVAFILVGHLSFIAMANGESGSVYSDFIKIEQYNTQEELQKLYEQAVKVLEENGPGGKKIDMDGMVYWEEPPADYFVAIYKYLLDNNLPYDSFVEFEVVAKYTPFHYFTNYSIYFGYFILLSCLIMGSLFQTSDVMTKMSKMVYSTGKKRSRIIDTKYAVSLIALLAFTLLADIIMGIVASGTFGDSGAKYCIMYSGSKLFTLNFFEFFMMNVASHLIIATLLYTIIYYLSIMCKNGVIMLCAQFVLIILLIIIEIPSAAFTSFVETALLGGFNAVLYSPSYYTNFKYIALLVPYIVAAIAIPFISRVVIKRVDYSR